ncbi:hypothetical protein GGR51DRAFT_329480 [Nemania sp. FL0031]|nr:hypothetical protein GGR51DRAFT_329480 [Nemania sp. FL0031]
MHEARLHHLSHKMADRYMVQPSLLSTRSHPPHLFGTWNQPSLEPSLGMPPSSDRMYGDQVRMIYLGLQRDPGCCREAASGGRQCPPPLSPAPGPQPRLCFWCRSMPLLALIWATMMTMSLCAHRFRGNTMRGHPNGGSRITIKCVIIYHPSTVGKYAVGDVERQRQRRKYSESMKGRMPTLSSPSPIQSYPVSPIQCYPVSSPQPSTEQNSTTQHSTCVPYSRPYLA